MKVKLVSHINGDGDILPYWFKYYSSIGVTSFHLIVHGSKDDNRSLFKLIKKYPAIIENQYKGEFKIEEKKHYLDKCIRSLKDNWILLVDSDEIIELPYKSLNKTIEKLKKAGANVMFAPMVQRIKKDGTLTSPSKIKDPFKLFPLCSIDLYNKLGVFASTSKYPLFYCSKNTYLSEGGNHFSPNGLETKLSNIQGLTHHFKWKSSVLERISKRAASGHTYRHESVQFLDYLDLK